MSVIWLIMSNFLVINGQKLFVHVYCNNLLLLCMVFIVNKAPFEESIIKIDQPFILMID